MSCIQSGKDHWHYKHGLRGTRLYNVWKGIKYRCYTPSCNNYEHYGGRGIKMCEEWEKDFMAFHDWAMSHGYDEKAPRGQCTIDRIDSNGDYSPDNCRIIGITEQENNRTNNHVITYKGNKYTLAQAEAVFGIPQRLLWKRLNYGWDIDRAMEEPSKGGTYAGLQR